MKVKQQLHDLKPYQPGKSKEEVKRELGLDKIVKLASNENPFGASPKVKAAIQECFGELAIYPDGYATDVRNKTAKHIGVKPEQLIFGSGSDEVIQIICRAILSPNTNTIMATPSFSQYRHNSVIEGAEIREIENINGEHDLEKMLASIDKQTRVIWVCTPNNPTGTYINEKKLRAFIERVPEDILVVVDEAYYEYVYADDYPDTISWLDEFPNLMVLRTFSKAYGLSSLRIGYGVGNPSFIRAIEPARGPFNTSRIAQAAAIAALDDQAFIESCKASNIKGLEQFYRFCEEYHLTYYPSQANFILIDFEVSGDQVFDHLLKNGFIVRSGEKLGYPTTVRITIGSEEQNAEIIKVLSEWLDGERQ